MMVKNDRKRRFRIYQTLVMAEIVRGFYEKNPIRYKFYRHNCGRDQRLKELWGE